MLRALIILFTLMAVQSVVAKEGAPIELGDWAGNVYTDDETGKFSHCLVSGDYKSGISLLISVNRYYILNSGFYNSAWPKNQNVQSLSYRFDSGDWQSSGARNVIDGRSFL